jgi:hypothetical protein
MRRFCWLLVCCLLLTGPRACALEFFGDVLYWQATEPVDWTLNTNNSPVNQFVDFKNVNYHFSPGFRVGVGLGPECQWGPKLSYTRFYTNAEDTVAGDVTPVFLGNRLSLFLMSPPYFDSGAVQSVIDYNVLDLDFGKSFCPVEFLQVRPVLGLRGAWINQTFDAQFQGSWLSGALLKTSSEHITNKFWGIGPKLGIENAFNLRSGDKCCIDLALNFYAAYLLGCWAISDVTINQETLITTNATYTTTSRFEVPINNRRFGALTFQAMVGVNFKFRHWNAMVGYEINDWLNQCQIFDDATGPHNNDLIVQGLNLRVGYGF